MLPQEIAQFIPFIGLATQTKTMTRPLITRLVEQSLPGILVAAVGLYVSSARMEEQILALRMIVQEVKAEIHEIRRDVYRPTLGQENK